MRQPLVSIMIPNYNHSRYLDDCIQSALNQTYPNIEIIVLDNASSDDSVEIAAKYRAANVRICRNSYNIASMSFSVLAEVLATGTYMTLLCADDYYVLDTFIEKAVAVMEKFPNVGYVHGERDFILEDGSIEKLDPFYRCSFVAPGLSVMPIYMVTTVAHPVQGIFRREAFQKMGGYDTEIDYANADKTLWFYLSSVSDCAYIREVACRIRVGGQTQTLIAQTNFYHPIFSHLILKNFVRFARRKNIPEVYEREEEALKKLAQECLVSAKGMMRLHKTELANTYMKYSKLLDPHITKDLEYQELCQMLQGGYVDYDDIGQIKQSRDIKKRGYEPPRGYIPIDSEVLCR